MSKYSDNESFPDISVGGLKSGNKQQSFNDSESAIASIIKVLSGEDGGYRGVGDVIGNIMTDQRNLININLSPMNPHLFTIPLPNEKVHCIKDGKTGNWYYTGIVSKKGMVNHMLNANNPIYKPDGDPYTGETFVSLPRSVRSLDLYEGDVVMQGRFGQSIRFSASNPTTTLPWESPTNSISPITIIRNGYLPVEDFETDSAGIWLTSNQHVEIPLQADLPPNLRSTQDKYGAGQVIIMSDRLILGSKTDDILLSSKKTIALCTQLWVHEVDTVLDTLHALIDEVKKLSTEVKTQAIASSQQTFPVPGIGSTLLSVQSPRFASSFQNTIRIETKLSQLKTNIEALKQK